MADMDAQAREVKALRAKGRSWRLVAKEMGISVSTAISRSKRVTGDPPESESMQLVVDIEPVEAKQEPADSKPLVITTKEERLTVNLVMLKHRLLDERIPHELQVFEDLRITSGPASKAIRLQLKADGNNDRIDEYIEAQFSGR